MKTTTEKFRQGNVEKMEEKFLVIVNRNFEDEEIYYCGDIEILAFKKFKELPYKMKEIVKANVKMVKIL